jgi:Na+/phosphate symporter
MIAYIAVILAMAGLALYLLAANPKAVEIGRLVFFAGMLAVALTLAQRTIKLF